jgi:hypothetical protein
LRDLAPAIESVRTLGDTLGAAGREQLRVRLNDEGVLELYAVSTD